MNFNPNVAIIKIGYNSFAIEDPKSALELMAIMSKAVQVDDNLYGVRDYSNCSHALAEDQSLPSLQFVAENKVNGKQTVSEIKAQGEREKKDREDLDGGVRLLPEPPTIAPPDDGVPF